MSFSFQVIVVGCLLAQLAAGVPYPFASPAKNCQLQRSTTDRGDCFLEPECNQVCKTEYDQQCSTNYRQQCNTVNEQQCNTVNKQGCIHQSGCQVNFVFLSLQNKYN